MARSGRVFRRKSRYTCTPSNPPARRQGAGPDLRRGAQIKARSGGGPPQPLIDLRDMIEKGTEKWQGNSTHTNRNSDSGALAAMLTVALDRRGIWSHSLRRPSVTPGSRMTPGMTDTRPARWYLRPAPPGSSGGDISGNARFATRTAKLSNAYRPAPKAPGRTFPAARRSGALRGRSAPPAEPTAGHDRT